MAWNRPQTNNKPVPAKSCWGNKLLVAACAVTLILSATILCVIHKKSNTESSTPSNRRSAIVDRSGKRRTKAIGKLFVATREADKTKALPKPEIVDSEVLFNPKTKGRLLIWQIKNPPVFTNQFEGYVADILTVEPGERFLDTTLDDEFDKSFNESLRRPIKINPDDSEEVVALKKAVLETTEEVRKRVLAGERPQDIIMDAMEELNKIADYRDGLQKAFNKYLLTEQDPNEILRYRDEANAILDEYGAQHIEAPEDEKRAREMLITAKEDKIQELTEAIESSEKEDNE